MRTIDELQVLELFGGIGAIRKALIRQGIPHRVVDYVEKDRNCVKGYNALYHENFQPIDIVEYHPSTAKVDLLMHGSPCQDFSRTGLKRGGERGSGTRSSLLYETIRIIQEMREKPKMILWENVKGVLDKNFRETFFDYIHELDRLGYTSQYAILNAMDFGIPQKRERIFMVSLLGEKRFDFSMIPRTPTRKITSFLEKDVPDFYQVRQSSILGYLNGKPRNQNFEGRVKVIEQFAYTISTKQVRVPNSGVVDLKNGTYRYLTERECFKLMGFEDGDFNTLRAIYPQRKGRMSSILYREAGNSIVVNILEAILQKLLAEVF